MNGPGERTLTVYATSDLHAHWHRRAGGGIAQVTAHLAAADRDRSLWIDNGDTLTGSLLGAFLAGRAEEHPLLPALEASGLDVAVPGNHDFDHGANLLARRVSALRRTAYVCANVQGPTGLPLFAPSVVLERAGLRVGVIGAVTGHLQRLTRYEAVSGVTVLDPVASVTAQAERLRPAVDVLLLSYHGGFEADPGSGRPTQYDTGEDQAHRLLRTVPGLDGLIAGHQHRLAAGLAQGVAGPVAYVQPGYAGERLGVLRFTVREGEIIQRSAETIVPAGGARAASAPHVRALDEHERTARRWLDEPSGLDEEDVHRVVAARTGAATTALLLPTGPLSWSQLAEALPPPYGVKRYRMPRSELVAALASAPAGLSLHGPEADALPEHVEIVATALLDGVLPEGRVQETRPYDWLDELVVAAGSR